MKTLAIILFFVSGAHLIAALLSFALALVLKRPANLGETMGNLFDAKNRKNVWLRGRNNMGIILKNFTRTKYRFVADGKAYIAKGTHFGTKNESRSVVSVKYLKKFPRVAFVEDGGDPVYFVAWVIAHIALAALWLSLGIYAL